jgi:Sulfotransferase domain
MRSGTSTLARWLGEHPQVFMAPGKELHFFDHHFDKGVDWYRSLFADAGSELQLGEATPNYLHEPAAIQRIASTLPQVRLLLSLRNPVDRAYSHYWHNRSRGKESLSFEDALAAEATRTSGGDADRAWFSYASRGDYFEQIEEVMRHFPRTALHVEIAEEMQADPQQSLERIFRFIEVDDRFHPAMIDRKVNAYVEFRSVRLRRFTKRLPSGIAVPINRLNARTNQEYTPMDPSTRSRLEARYADGNHGLAQFLRRDPPLWPAKDQQERLRSTS